jgi:hypothetical protein
MTLSIKLNIFTLIINAITIILVFIMVYRQYKLTKKIKELFYKNEEEDKK